MLPDIESIWGVRDEPAAATSTTWEVSAEYILKRLKTERNARNNVRLSAALRREGVPVSDIIPTQDGRDYIVTPGGCYLLMKRLGGSHIRDIFHQDYQSIAYQTGIVAAKIHSALLAITDKQEDDGTPFDKELQGWVSDTLSAGSLLAPEEWSGPVASLCAVYPRLPKQQIHRDIHYGNLLFEGTALTGVLDFDLGKRDARLFDLAYFLLGQLLGQEDLEAVQEQWFAFIDRFIEGYESLTILDACERETLPLMMQCIELLFAAYWEQQGNREAGAETVNIFRFITRSYRGDF